MSEGAAKEQQFEQVLSRLDALIKRSHYGAATYPSLPEQAAIAAAAESPAESEMAATTIEPDDTATHAEPIPVLTDIYAGEGSIAQTQAAADIHAAVENLIHSLHDAIQHAMQEEFASMQRALAARLRSEITAALQRQTPVLGGKAQDISGD